MNIHELHHAIADILHCEVTEFMPGQPTLVLSGYTKDKLEIWHYEIEGRMDWEIENYTLHNGCDEFPINIQTTLSYNDPPEKHAAAIQRLLIFTPFYDEWQELIWKDIERRDDGD